ncbi:MAG: hypothetical protein JNK10_02005 [Cyclobacteriaceae bacterium]|nr:hypothetical protein [Cyclobacteriaceae bacterium]
MKSVIIIAAMMLSCIVSGIAHPGIGIVHDSKGNVYFTDLAQVWKITADGRKTIVVPNVHTHELFMDDNDNLFGEHLWYNGEQKNTWSHYVWKLTTSTARVEKVIPDKEGLRENYSFVRDHFGTMYWQGGNEHCQTIERKGRNNQVARVGSSCFENIRAMHALADGSLAVVDFQDLKQVDKQGKVTTIASRMANPDWKEFSRDNQHSVMGVWDDADGNLYTAVSHLRLIKKFGKDGKESVPFKSTFPWAPSGGMVDANGQLWVLEFNPLNSVRVQRVDVSGNVKTF